MKDKVNNITCLKNLKDKIINGNRKSITLKEVEALYDAIDFISGYKRKEDEIIENKNFLLEELSKSLRSIHQTISNSTLINMFDIIDIKALQASSIILSKAITYKRGNSNE